MTSHECQRDPCVCQQAEDLVNYAKTRGVELSFSAAVDYVVVANALPNYTHGDSDD